MQRYRVNYGWLIGVFVTSLVLAVTAFFVWSWQVDRNAGRSLERANQARAEGNLVEEYQALQSYVRLRKDDEPARIQLAEAAIKVLESEESSFEQRGYAFGLLDRTVRVTDDPSLRRKLAEIVINFRPHDAITHIEDLLADDEGNPELNALLIRALFQAKDYSRVREFGLTKVGYDKKEDKFAPEKAQLKGESDAYALLSDVLAQKDQDKELARRVIDEMVAMNPESPQSHLRKSIFLSSMKEEEEAVKFLDKAYELDPTDAAILSRKGMVALGASNDALDALKEEDAEEPSEEELAEAEKIKQAKLEEAKSYFATGLEKHPDNVLFYRLMAETEMRLDEREKAMAILDKGIANFDKFRSADLVIYKLDLLYSDEDFSGMEREIKRLVSLNRPDIAPVIDFQRARIKFRKQQWAEAARELKRVRPLLFERANFQALAGTMLGISYESQGINDLALQAYDSVLNDFPSHGPAREGKSRVLKKIDQFNPDPDTVDLDMIVDNTLRLPEAEQDWARVSELVDETIEENGLTIAQAKLLRAKVFIKRAKYEEAKALIREAAQDAPDDINVHFAAILLVLSDPGQGAVEAMSLLDRLEKKWGRSLRSLVQRADLMARINSEDVSVELRSLISEKDGLTEGEKLKLYKVVGLKFEQLSRYDEAQEFYEKSMALEPNNLPIRMHMFELAVKQGDDAAMRAAQAEVLEFVGSKNDSNYILTEVKRQMLAFSRGELTREELAKARPLLDRALRQRETWHELYIVYGQLLLLLNEDLDLALENFDKALEYGPAKTNAVSIQVKVLYDRGLFAEARERMERLKKDVRPRVLGKLEPEILIKTGDPEEGFLAAEKIAKALPNDPKTQIWFSKIAQDMGKLKLAATTLRAALKQDSSDPDNWLRLIGLYAEQKRFDEVVGVIRESQLSSDAEFLPLLTAKSFELMSRWQDAERIYLASYEGQFERLVVARRMAEFYLLWAKKDEANLKKAAIYLNRILKSANDGDAKPNNPHVVWARQTAARLLYAREDYQDSLRAERLLRQSALNDTMTPAESNLLVDILISRNDPQSLLQAKQLLTELKRKDRLTKLNGLKLARILSQTNQWQESKALMLELISKNLRDPLVRVTHIEMLIDQGEYDDAERGLKRLQEIDAKNPSLVQLSARLAYERGDKAALKNLLASLVPKFGGKLEEGKLKTLLSVAQLATRYGEYEIAGKLYTAYVSKVPEGAFELARFHAYHGDPEQGLELMKRLYPDNPDNVIQLANRMIKVRRDEVGDKYDDAVNRFLDEGLRDDPDSVTRRLARAEAYETQEDYKRSIEEYERLLQRDDLPTRLRAAAKNNLGFLLALLEQRVDDAERLINEAMETFGPVEDMLDTRAIVHIAQEKYDLAIEDMELALSVSRDPIKHYHLAKAYILAGDGAAAMKAWEKAQSLGFERNALPALERATFEQIVQKIESFQTQNAKL